MLHWILHLKGSPIKLQYFCFHAYCTKVRVFQCASINHLCKSPCAFKPWPAEVQNPQELWSCPVVCELDYRLDFWGFWRPNQHLELFSIAFKPLCGCTAIKKCCCCEEKVGSTCQNNVHMKVRSQDFPVQHWQEHKTASICLPSPHPVTIVCPGKQCISTLMSLLLMTNDLDIFINKFHKFPPFT